MQSVGARRLIPFLSQAVIAMVPLDLQSRGHLATREHKNTAPLFRHEQKNNLQIIEGDLCFEGSATG